MIAAQRPYRVVLPVLLIVGGLVFLLVNLGTFPDEAGWRLLQLWPLLLILLGVQILVPHLFRGAAAFTVTLILVLLLAFGALAYVIAGPGTGTGSLTRVESSAAFSGQSSATIRIDDAADQINITAGNTGSDLYQARIDYARSAPQLSYDNGQLHITRSANVFNSWGTSRDVVALSVNQSVAWTIVIDGAGTNATIDLSNAKLQLLQLNGAGSNANVKLGSPAGAVRVTANGLGVGLTLQMPATAEYRVTVNGIGTSVSGTAETPAWPTAHDRYDVSVEGVGTHAIVTTAG